MLSYLLPKSTQYILPAYYVQVVGSNLDVVHVVIMHTNPSPIAFANQHPTPPSQSPPALDPRRS